MRVIFARRVDNFSAKVFSEVLGTFASCLSRLSEMNILYFMNKPTRLDEIEEIYSPLVKHIHALSTFSFKTRSFL
jgi:pantothenate kinase